MKNLKFTPAEWNLRAVKALYIDFDLENPTEDKKTIKDDYLKIISQPYAWEEPKSVYFNDGFCPLDGHNMQISMIGSELEKTVENNEKTFLNDVLEVLKATPQHLYNFQTRNPYSTLKTFPEYESLDNISLGFKVSSFKPHKDLIKFNKQSIKNKYIIFDSIRNGFDEIDFSEYLFDYVVVDLSEKKISNDDIEQISALKQKCEDYNIPFYFKSWGNAKCNPNPNDPTISKYHPYHAKGGCMLDGKLYLDNPSEN